MKTNSTLYDYSQAEVTVILPVYNSPWLVEKAILSTVQTKNRTQFKVAIYDDGSDSYTKELISRLALNNGQIKVDSRKENKGYIKTVNKALKDCDTPYALLLNSDVVLTDYWLDRMIEVAESDRRIATVNPLTNRASQLEIALSPGVNFLEVSRYLQKKFKGALDVVTGVGFCMLLRMEALQQVGLFDEIYGDGYCEESDLCMRLTTNGWRTVAAPNVYVYHKGAGSFTNKRERYLQNRRIFDNRWSAEYRSQFNHFQRNNPLKPVRDYLSPPQRWSPLSHARQTYRLTRAALYNKQPHRAFKELIKGALSLPNAKTAVTSKSHNNKFKSSSNISVTYILPRITMAGGVISVLQLVNELVLLGIDARIATLHVYPEMEEWQQFSSPMVFRNYQDMLHNLPDTDIAIATHWSTAQPAYDLQKKGRANHSIYFVQDYEPWFYTKEGDSNRKKAEKTYKMLECKIVKSNWLVKMLQPFGGQVHKIRLGMDLGVFYPREKRSYSSMDSPIVLSMARPRTPQRGFDNLVRSLSILKERFPEIKIHLFGDDLKKQSIPFPFTDMEIIVDRNTLCQAYSEADIFIDASDFQGFGRPALEAMACGTACVLTDVGGVNEYAINGQNALLVPPKAPNKLSDAVAKLIENTKMRQYLAKQGQETAKGYCHKREALETAEFFQKITNKTY